MIWPFNRKRKVNDQRVPNDFRPGDKVECIVDRWQEPADGDPALGDILTVSAVTDQVNHRSVRCYWLWFNSTPSLGYNSQAFRKIVEADDAVLVQRIKSARKSKRVRA